MSHKNFCIDNLIDPYSENITDLFNYFFTFSSDMTCTQLCKILSFGSTSPIKNAKFCLSCGIFILTESENCACCGSVIKIWDRGNIKNARQN